jgi:tRNA G18 (ribose-2'-O)-methylase SpoU
VKISSGAIFHIPIVKVINLSRIIMKLKENFFTIISTSPSGTDEAVNLGHVDNVALIIGNEEKGVRKNILNKSDIVLKLPKYGKTSSLNASSSAAIFIYNIKKAMKV